MPRRHNSIIDMDRKAHFSKKKTGINNNAHLVSQEFKELGYMTKNGRT
jgi:hypothetical protein